jgi:hypothetical protein
VDPDRNTHIRNVAIIIVLAVAVWKLPGGGTAASTISNIFSVLFMGGLLWLGYRLYREHRDTITGLEERQRGIAYGAFAVAVFALAATGYLWSEFDLLGGMVWMLLIGGASWALYSVWRAYSTY